jgi:hypothetical protein
VSATSIDFGNVVVGQYATKPVVLTARGTAPVTISGVSVAGSLFTVSGLTAPATLNPGQSVTLSVKFYAHHASSFTGAVTVSSNSSSNPNTLINLSGTGSAGVSTLGISAASVDFGNVAVGQYGTKPVVVTATGTAPVTIFGISVAGSLFTVSGLTAPATLNPGQSATLSLKFYAHHASSFTGAVTISSNSSSNPNAVINLSGTGSAGVSTLGISAASVDFGNVAVGQYGTKGVVLTATGTAPVTISGISVAGSLFTVSGLTAPATLNPGQSATLSLKFYAHHASSFTGSVTISSNSSSNPNALISLSGTGSAAAALSAMSCNNATMSASGADSCTVTLNGAAPTGGLVVSLSSNNGAVSVPTAVTVPANATSAGFWATVSPFTSPQSVTLAASAGGVSKTFALQLSSSQAALSINATSVAFGSVVLNSSATQTVTLKSTGTSAVTVNSAAVTGSGFTVSGSAFPVTLSPGQSVSLSVQFNPKSTGSASGQLTISSNATSNPKAVISLSGTGATHEVDLTWNAPSGSITGYHVYRTASGGSSFQLLSSYCADTSYADTTVQSGQAYDYIVKSVNASGVESAPSNKTSVQIP